MFSLVLNLLIILAFLCEDAPHKLHIEDAKMARLRFCTCITVKTEKKKKQPTKNVCIIFYRGYLKDGVPKILPLFICSSSVMGMPHCEELSR